MNNLVSTDLENRVDGLFCLTVCHRLLPPGLTLLMKVSLSFICSATGRGVRLVLVRRSWLERIRRVGRNDRPLPNPGCHSRKNPKRTEGSHEACEYLALSRL